MNIQIFGKSKCFDTQKAQRYFKERRIKFQAIDLLRYGMSKGELQSVVRAVGLGVGAPSLVVLPSQRTSFRHIQSQCQRPCSFLCQR